MVFNVKKEYIYVIIGLFLALVLVVFLQNQRQDQTPGLTYIQKQEKLSTKELALRFSQEKEGNETENVFAKFHDYVFLGDSRVVGYKSYGFLEDSRVLADTGDSVLKIDSYLDTVQKMEPSYVYISYGLNDLGRNYPGGYVATVQQEVEKVQKVAPHAKIYVCGIIPVSAQLTSQDGRWQQIPSVNKQLKAMCKKKKWIYVADETLANDSIYAGDGMHFQPSFYETWANTILQSR